MPTKFTTLDELCQDILGKFSAMRLRYAAQGKKISTGATLRPLEAQYQDEFYTGFNKVAGRGVPICSEWSRTSTGRVDFWIPEKKWAIELLRDHDRVDEHIARFKEGGKYFSWLKDNMIDDWIIINCTTSPPTREYSEPRLWHAVLASDYTELSVYREPLMEDNDRKEPFLKVCLEN